MTAASATEELEAKLLDVGADDFLRKPFSIEVLLGRVRAQLRRTPPRRRTHTHIGGLTIHHRQCTVGLNGRSIHLTPKEHGVLAVLAERPGQIVPKPDIMERVWAPDSGDIHDRQMS
ncbi:MAG: response regulator transcription factor [Armatimonadota bacterium]